MKQAETDAGARPGTTSSDAERIAALERENRELRRANQILKSAATFFAAELDRPCAMKVEFVDSQQAEHGVQPVLQALEGHAGTDRTVDLLRRQDPPALARSGATRS